MNLHLNVRAVAKMMIIGLALFSLKLGAKPVLNGEEKNQGSPIPAVFTPAGTNWMNSIPDRFNLAQFSIPGTHDSAARYIADPFTPDSAAKTQDLTIREQLDIGVRFLDLRCRHIGNACALHHGRAYLSMNLSDALKQIVSFLDANKSETVIVSIKDGEHDDEGNTRTFEATLRSYLEDPSQRKFWYTGSSIPQLGQAGDEKSVRGKAILLRRFKAEKDYGIDATDWPGNTTGVMAHSISVQDFYNMGSYLLGQKPDDYPEKWRSVERQLESASKDSTLWYLNFTSAVVFTWQPIWPDIPNIPLVSNYINPRVARYFSSQVGHFGTVVMDFMTPDLAQKIYMSTISGLALTDPDHDGIPSSEEVAREGDPFTSIRIVQYGFDIRLPYKAPIPKPIQMTTDIPLKSFHVRGLPKGLKLDRTAGFITGIPEQSGFFPLLLEADGASGEKASTAWSLKVEVMPEIAYPSSRSFRVNQRVNIQPRKTVRHSWPVYGVSSGHLPSGVYLDPQSGTLKGHIDVSNPMGRYPFVISAKNTAGTKEVPLEIRIFE